MKDQFLSLGYVRKQWCQRCVLFFISLLIQVLFVRWYWLKSLQDYLDQTAQLQTSNATSKQQCMPHQLQGRLKIGFAPPPSFDEIGQANPAMGQAIYKPSECQLPYGHRVAIIIPFRDITPDQYRTKHLKWLLHYMILVLIRQNIMFSFYIINQESCSKF